MMIGISEGTVWRFEVIEHPDGFMVQSRDLVTNALDGPEQKLFRTAVAALSYADLSAALDRAASARSDGDLACELITELDTRNSAFREISDRLLDGGTDAWLLAAWQDRGQPERRLLH